MKPTGSINDTKNPYNKCKKFKASLNPNVMTALKPLNFK